MAQVVATRFMPTISDGHLHMGHLVNLYINFFYAKKHNGKFHVVADQYIEAENVKSNMDVLSLLLPGFEIHKFVINEDTKNKLKDKVVESFGERFFKDLPNFGDHFYVALLDYVLGVNAVIRGDDWRHNEANDIHLWVLQELSYCPIITLYHALLFDSKKSQDKISKSHPAKESMLEYLMCLSVDRVSLLLYALRAITKQNILLNELPEFYKKFSICNILSFSKLDIYNVNEVVDLDKELKRNNTGSDLTKVYRSTIY
tara:strand:- start:10569 stop:11342 length:774 start_codon:yes stop_codon:yes gene_type:complete